MKRYILCTIISFLLISTNLFAADGDLIVNGNIGIGTETPGAKLEISGTDRGITVTNTKNTTASSYSDILKGVLTDAPANQKRIVLGLRNWGDIDGNPVEYRIFTRKDDNTYGTTIAQFTEGKINLRGNVGIGTTGPIGRLHVAGSNVGVVIDQETTYNAIIKEPNNNNLVLQGYGLIFKTNATIERMRIDSTGKVGIGTTTPKGALDVNGSIYQRGSVLHADYVFGVDYKLESIEEHADYMWKNKHLKAIPKQTMDENGQEIVEVGSHSRGIVEELEKAHIYIEQLINT